jgi:biotin carboxyl carrier protein
MKYHVRVDGESLEVELVERGGRTYARIEGKELPAELAPVRSSGSYSLLAGRTQLPVVASGPNDDLTLVMGSETWHCSVQDSREALAAAAAGRAGNRAGGGVLRSVMPGIVRDVRVAEGDAVERGQALLILEAMKMENEIRADADGSVSKVHVAPGTAVAKGDPLVTLG